MNAISDSFSDRGTSKGAASVAAEGEITFQGVSKRFGDFVAVNDASFSIDGGSFVSILGPSGCGKTTTLRLIAGFDFASAGCITIGGADVGFTPPFQRPINMVFQNYALFPHLSVFDNIAYGLRSRRTRRPKAEVDERVNEMIRTVQLQGKEKSRTWELSGGQQQRVALARAIVNNPKMLILDEPLAALDKKLRRDVQFELQSLQRDLGITFIMVTHDQHEALSLSDKIIVMNKGGIEQIGSPQDLYNRPASKFVASFIGDFNLHQTRVEKIDGGQCGVKLGRQRIQVPCPEPLPTTGSAVSVGYRPADLKLVPSNDLTAITLSTGRITNIIYLGETAEVRLSSVDLGDVLARVGMQGLQEHRFSVGQDVELTVDGSKCLIFKS